MIGLCLLYYSSNIHSIRVGTYITLFIFWRYLGVFSLERYRFRVWDRLGWCWVLSVCVSCWCYILYYTIIILYYIILLLYYTYYIILSSSSLPLLPFYSFQSSSHPSQYPHLFSSSSSQFPIHPLPIPSSSSFTILSFQSILVDVSIYLLILSQSNIQFIPV